MVPIGNEFDVYLSALGFMPVDEHAAAGGRVDGLAPVVVGAFSGSPTGVGVDGVARFAAVGGGPNAMAVQQQQQQQQQHQQHHQQQQQQHQASQLGDWFSGNRYMMGLLEEDLSHFHPNVWNHGGV